MRITASPLKKYKTVKEYKDFLTRFNNLEDNIEKIKFNRLLCRTDLFWLIWYACSRKDVAQQWLLDRCKEVEAEPNGHLDLWARNHYKSTIITFGKTIQDILGSHGEEPLPEWERELTAGIFSITRPLAKGFLKQVKQEFERNQLLKSIFPDILYEKPEAQSPKWSEDEGIIVKRKSNPKEATLEAWGLIDGQPTGKHFVLRIYDDVVNEKSVTTPEMIAKTTQQWQMSSNLGTRGGIVRYIGTRYHANDTYAFMLENEIATPRLYPATEDGTIDGKPVFLNQDELEEKRRNQGSYVFSCQMLQNPVADSIANFKQEWIKYFGSFQKGDKVANIYITVDPAHSKKKTSDYTVMCVIACCADGNYYLIDMIRDRLSLKERTEKLFELHRHWRPIAVGYERYGLQSDIEHIRCEMDNINYHFNVIELAGKVSKEDRIRKLQPLFEHGRFWMPYQIIKNNYEGKKQNLIDIFIKQEYLSFPVSAHDDMLDAMARILEDDLNVVFPSEDYIEQEKNSHYYESYLYNDTRSTVTGY
jgi:predicted phage terminase large subunit-like protein